ncbi:phytanoyl-CoA dioxygenase family protein [Alienimonas californiensis]|uniref:Phytanoyl-CoA dioxygenase (PhyH) n=1 Tax=Alienimonas californiensis TaxID=2527989 RepID=A0A517PDL1_9PLAN|nr:phytanoyl-CoA dioxygenase family protein [Alienimonas californiensis]QDT17449.1 Phytanoyl-CoA dioxygenase (PhyH) [Alienimonas californiensis]
MQSAAPVTFDAIPDVSGENRDLRFRPGDPTTATALSPEQVAAFNDRGHVAPLPAFEPAEADRIRAYFDGLLAQALAAGKDSYSLSTAHLSHGGVYDLLTHPTLVAYAADLLGEHVVGWGSHFFCKMPGDGTAVGWHQDASFWPLSPSHAVTVWLAIDDADEGNGCMRFLAGSHHSGHLTYRESTPEDHSALNQVVPNAEQYGTEVLDELRAGTCSVHSDLLLHGSEANPGPRRRCGLTLRYCSAGVRAGQGWNAKGVVVRGEDPSGHWANPPRPAGPGWG